MTIERTGETLTLEYVKRYGVDTKKAQEWFANAQVATSTERGLWRVNDAGYTSDVEHAQIKPFAQAYKDTRDLGPEKYTTYVRVRNVQRPLSVSGAVQIHGFGSTDVWSIYEDKRAKWRWRRHTAFHVSVVGASHRAFDSRYECEENAARCGWVPS